MRARSILAVMTATALFTGCAHTKAERDAGAGRTEKQAPAFRASDLDALVGPVWRGSLEYMDYTTGKPTTIRSTLRVTRLPADAETAPAWSMAIGYDDEPHADGASTLRLLKDGTAIRNDDTVERVIGRLMDKGVIEVTTEHRGADNDRPATIRREYRFMGSGFAIKKLVKYEDAADFFQRHEYQWKRDESSPALPTPRSTR